MSTNIEKHMPRVMTSLLFSSPPISLSHRLFSMQIFKFQISSRKLSFLFWAPPPKRPGELASRLWIPYCTWFRILFKWNSDSGFQSLAGFWVPRAKFRIPKLRVPDSSRKDSPYSGIRVTFTRAKFISGFTCVGSIWILRDSQWPSAQNCLLESREWSWRTRPVTSYKHKENGSGLEVNMAANPSTYTGILSTQSFIRWRE